MKGDEKTARAALTEANRLGSPDTTIARARADSFLVTPAVRDRYEAVLFTGLRKAGMPEK